MKRRNKANEKKVNKIVERVTKTKGAFLSLSYGITITWINRLAWYSLKAAYSAKRLYPCSEDFFLNALGCKYQEEIVHAYSEEIFKNVDKHCSGS